MTDIVGDGWSEGQVDCRRLFDENTQPMPEAQLGLVGMRERAHLVGGSMTVESSRGGGTTVCVTIPIPSAATLV